MHFLSYQEGKKKTTLLFEKYNKVLDKVTVIPVTNGLSQFSSNKRRHIKNKAL